MSAFAGTPEDALRELAIAWQGVKESYRKHHEPIPQAPVRQADKSSHNVSIDEQQLEA